MIETYARLRHPELPASRGPYLRALTGMWCGFFIVNMTVSALLALYGTLEAWTVYNGILAYVLIGILLAGERVYRYWRFRNYQDGLLDPVFRRVFPPPAAGGPALTRSVPGARAHAAAGPEVLGDSRGERRCERVLRIPEDLDCLSGHFPGFPVVPGVAQIGWVLEAARELLPGPTMLKGIEALKFKRLLRPADVVHLRIEVSPDHTAAAFRLWDTASVVSSGRLRFEAGSRAQHRVNPCLLIPIFNHKETIGGVLDGLAPLRLPCLVVNDGSDGETTEVLSRLAARWAWVEVEHLGVNRGRGAALRHGYRTAHRRGFSHVVQLDADGQHDPAEVGTLLDAAERAPEALVLGDPRFDETAPRSRLYGRRLSQMIVWAYTGSLAVHDPLCGFRCFPLAPTVALLDRHRFGDRMDFDPEIVVRLAWTGLPIVNVAVRVRYFPQGRSHFRLVRDNVLIAATYGRLLLALLGRTRGSRPGPAGPA